MLPAHRLSVVFLLLSLLTTCCSSFYIPGVPMRSYQDGDPVFLKVNKLVSSRTQLPYAYYDLPFCRPPQIVDAVENLGEILSGDRIENSPYELHTRRDVKCAVLCRRETSTDELALFAERIDEDYRVNWIVDGLPGATRIVLSSDDDSEEHVHFEPGFALGQVVLSSSLPVSARDEQPSNSINRKNSIDGVATNDADANAHPDSGDDLLKKSSNGKEHERLISNKQQRSLNEHAVNNADHDGGESKHFYLNNHVDLVIFYHVEDADHPKHDDDSDKKNPTEQTKPSTSKQQATGGHRIVGFEVRPRSILHGSYDFKDAHAVPETCLLADSETRPLEVHSGMAPTSISWTYSVQWIASETKWSSRWDVYLMMSDDQSSVHWFSIVNSLLIVVFLTGMIAMIMMRAVNSDFRRYREGEDQEDPQEETGWKLVHGDVFRPPRYPLQLAVLVGSGVQMLTMSVITLVFAVLGFLSPANRGGLLTSMVVLFMLMGVFAGYFGARVYKMFNGLNWKHCTLMIASAFPATIFSIFLILNCFLYGEHSAGYVPLGTLFSLLALWILLSVPLVFAGSYFGFRKPAPEHPVRTNQIPRQIPHQVWYMHPVFCILIGGVLPFGAIFIEVFFILSSIWLHQFYYIFGFLALVFFILIVTCAEITIVMCYFQLCSEDYKWWWRSFLTSAASSLYGFVYATFYFLTKLEISKPVSIILYFGYTLIMTIAFALLTGTIGFAACLFFVRKIYSAIKVN